DKDLKGWLKRKGGRMNSWSRRWVVLKDQLLFIFLKEEDRKYQDCIILDGQIIVEPPPDPGEPRHGYFDIVTGHDKGSTETLSLCAETEEEKKIWLHALKRALYASKGGALFSQSLDEILYWERLSGRPVCIPYIVNECVEYLYKYGLDVEGIFRLPGRQSAIKDVISRFERGQKINFEEENTDVHIVASVLKTFLRDLPESLIPCQLFQKFMNIALRFMEEADESAREKCVQELADSMKLIPRDNYVVLKYVCRFLREVGLHEPTNKMSMMSLGTVFGYNLIRHIDKENSQLFLCTADLGQNLVYMLLNFYPQVFMLEYSDRGSLGNNVPTADLLRMSRIIDTPAALPLNSSAILDLEGIELTIESASSTGSSDSVKITEDYYSLEHSKNNCDLREGASDAESVFVQSAEFALEKKRNLRLDLKEHAAISRSFSTPTSPNTSPSIPPVPPRRTKSKITRNRLISNKKRPEAAVFDTNDQSIYDFGSSEGVNSDDILTALAQVTVHNAAPSVLLNSVSVTSSQDSITSEDHSSAESNLKASHVTETDGKVGPSVSDLHNQITALKEELSRQKDHYRKQVTALTAQIEDMKEKYERRIQTMEVEFRSQIRELENKLSSEQESCAAAIANNIKLNSDINKYNMLYGDLL
ncbi:unnamed protein product, partial [Candidula unifasciata]